MSKDTKKDNKSINFEQFDISYIRVLKIYKAKVVTTYPTLLEQYNINSGDIDKSNITITD